MVQHPAYSVERAFLKANPMTQFLKSYSQRPPINRAMISKSGYRPAFRKSQALVMLEAQIPDLYRNRLIAERLDDAIRYFKERPRLAQRLMALTRRPDGISLLRQHLAPFRSSYNLDDPVRPNQEGDE